jgi:hypothetical protein
MYSAFAFSICALVAVAYAAGMFLFRAIALKNVRPPRACRSPSNSALTRSVLQRHSVQYHDAVGPTVLGAIVTAALLTNFVLRYREL